jgi:hypothetical protein
MLIQNAVLSDSILASEPLLPDFCNTIGTSATLLAIRRWSAFGQIADILLRRASAHF